jgi:hypothetical protein
MTATPKPGMNARMIADAGDFEVDNSNCEGEPFDLSAPDEDVDDDKA